MLIESLRLFYRTDDAFGTILVGTALTMLSAGLAVVWLSVLLLSLPVGLAITPLVLLPSLVTRGYLLRVVRAGIANESVAPSFVRWGSLVRDGSKSVAVSAGYLLPAVVFLGIAGGAGVAAVRSPPENEAIVQAAAAILITISGFGFVLYGLVYLYIRPAARALLATSGSIRTTLQPRRVGRLAFTREYATGWLVAVGLLLVGPVVLLPVGAASGLLAVVDPVVALIAVLATLLGGICLFVTLRVSAVWATGRGAAAGLVAADVPATLQFDPSADSSFSSGEEQTQMQPTEASPAVQVGRTVSPALDNEKTEPPRPPTGHLYPPVYRATSEPITDERDSVSASMSEPKSEPKSEPTLESDHPTAESSDLNKQMTDEQMTDEQISDETTLCQEPPNPKNDD